MTETLPRTTTVPMSFEEGPAVGFGHRWHGGQYCSILTPVGIVGCGIYDVNTAAEFGQAIAIAKGTPEHPLVDPTDLLTARIVAVTPQAADYGVRVGMTGEEAANCLLKAARGVVGSHMVN